MDSPGPKAELVRGIRKWDLVALTINAIVGAGIFGLPSELFSRIGVYSLLAFVVCALTVTLRKRLGRPWVLKSDG